MRPTWDEYFIGLMEETGKRATCDRGRSGCLIVRENRVLAGGYVGSPPKLPHCDEVGHMLVKVIDEDDVVRQHCVRTVHAEQNAICQAARFGVALQGATLYSNMVPCRVCAMLIISVGIVRVVAKYQYHAGKYTREGFKLAGVELVVLSESEATYEGKQ